MGAQVFVTIADVGDEARLREAVDRAYERFGHIDGFIHAAGASPLKTLNEITRLECEEQFRPKAQGLYSLEKAFEGRDLDFGLIVSSLSSVLGILGLAAYPAAHTFMDAFAYRHNQTDPTPWMTVNWDNWMTKREPETGAALIGDELYMTAEEGVEVFNTIMSVEPVTQVLVSTADLGARIDKWVNREFLQGDRSSREARPASLHARPAMRTDYAAPRTEEERVLVEIWQQTLGFEKVGIDDNYFDLGGDSVLAIHIIARARKAGLRLTPRQLFNNQTIAELAAAAASSSSPAAPAEPDELAGPAPLTPIQRWFFEQGQPDPHHWNLSTLLEVREELDLPMLQKIVSCLVENHEALCLRFIRRESDWQQESVPLDEKEFVTEFNLSGLAGASRRTFLEEAAARLQTRLDLSNGPLLQIALFDFGSREAKRLLLIIHHLLVDIVSIRILLEDFQTAYQKIRDGETLQLAARTTSFTDWARKLLKYARSRELRSERDYWLSQPWGKVTPLPVDFSDGINTEETARAVSVWLDVEETRALVQEVPQVYNTQINDVLLTALARSFSGWTGSPLLLVDLEGHGREEIIEGVELWRTIGWFTTIFPVCLDLEGITDPSNALKAVKEQLRRIPNRGIGYGLLRYLGGDSDTVRIFKELPQPQVAFLYMGQFDQALSGSSLFGAAKESPGASRCPRGMRQHLLDVSGYVFQGKLRVDVTYSQSIHRRSTIEGLARSFIDALRLIIADCQAAGSSQRTPSDFPGARLSQKQLDKVVTKISRLQGSQLKK
jgi:non-ribosomal peptide synthase protein (TIGR01720 family)